MPDKDTLYHELLEDLRAGGCPVCRAAYRAGDSYLNALLHEGVVDVRIRDELRAARGPCHRHAWRMARKRGSVLGTAIVYRDIVNTLTQILDAAESAPLRLFGGNKQALCRQLASSSLCPACDLEADAIRRAGKTLLKHLSDPEIADGYALAGGLCMTHFQVVLGHASEGATRTLAGWQAAVFRQLRAELDELIRKHDHRFRGEPILEREAGCWTRAVAAVVGQEESLQQND